MSHSFEGASSLPYDSTFMPGYADEWDSPRDVVTPWLEGTLASVENYAREKPWSFGLWMMGIGVVLGWRLKPW